MPNSHKNLGHILIEYMYNPAKDEKTTWTEILTVNENIKILIWVKPEIS